MKARLQTSKGDIRIVLNADKAPETVDNFIRYANDGFYDNTIFHRVIDNFMIQGGGHTPDLARKTTRESIRNEADNGLSNLSGTIAMARTSHPHSATAQFFINVGDNTFLDHTESDNAEWGYCVFGEVESGLDVVNAIKDTPTTIRDGMQDVPVDDVIITKVEIVE